MRAVGAAPRWRSHFFSHSRRSRSMPSLSTGLRLDATMICSAAVVRLVMPCHVSTEALREHSRNSCRRVSSERNIASESSCCQQSITRSSIVSNLPYKAPVVRPARRAISDIEILSIPEPAMARTVASRIRESLSTRRLLRARLTYLPRRSCAHVTELVETTTSSLHHDEISYRRGKTFS